MEICAPFHSKETEAQENEVIWAGSHRGEGEGSLSFFIVFFPLNIDEPLGVTM